MESHVTGSWESYDTITKLMYEYHRCYNFGLWDELAELFAEGTIRSVYPWSEEGHGVQRGMEIADIRRRMVRLHEGLPRVQFSSTNVVLDIDDEADRATGWSQYIALMGVSETWSQYIDVAPRASTQPLIEVFSVGRYEDAFVRVDGQWRFENRTCYADFTGDRSHHMSIDPIEYGQAFEKGDLDAIDRLG